MNVAAAVKILSIKTESTAKGSDAVFIKLNNKWAVKFFYNEEARDYSYDWHEKCLEIGIAPKMGGKVDFQGECNLRDGICYKYGYVTEIVKIAQYSVELMHQLGLEDLAELEIYDEEHVEQWRVMADIFYSNFGFFPFDIHMGNWGFNSKGESVIIDFSRITWGDNPVDSFSYSCDDYDDDDDDCCGYFEAQDMRLE